MEVHTKDTGRHQKRYRRATENTLGINWKETKKELEWYWKDTEKKST